MSLRGGRDRPRRDYPLRSEEKSHHGRSSAPPSRHLWIGNLSHSLTERALSNQFREFGELESVAFQPGRSYAFVNFIDEGAAFAAYEALQGFVLAGNALRIEFTKAEKSSASKHDEHYSRPRDEPRSSVRGSMFPQRDSRTRHTSSDPIYHNRNENAEQPSEVLWVGFPQSMKVDEDGLWNAFAPFGEIEKISMFPGRTFAFVRYKHVNSASRAINNLQGKLFNNPRVHISFAKSDSGPSNTSPRGRRHDRYHDTEHTRRSRSPRYMDPEGLDDGMGFDRKRNRPTGRNAPFEPPRFHDVGPDMGLPGNMYGRNSPIRDRVGPGFHDYPPQSFRHQGPLYNDEDEWDLPEDALVYHGAKKLKSNLVVPHEQPELPEYPFFESEQVKHVLPRAPEFPRHDMIDNNLGHFGYHKQIIPDHPPVNIPQQPFVGRGNSGNSSYDSFQTGLAPSAQNPVEWKRSTPEPATGEWKWEGVIAKGGTSICRARCFPVGKVLDMNLPEFLDCTARTNLDVLAKHYYRASKSWVVFFVPESDADMGFYNEFMNYLGEKERAAVAKLDDKTTLFLVPPSDFSEKILKVPGKLSISGVILRLDSSSSGVEPLPPPPPPPPPLPPQPHPYLVSSHGEDPRSSFASPSGTYPPFSNHGKPRANSSLPGLPLGPVPFRNMVEPVVENTQDHVHHQQQQQNLIAGGRNLAPPSRGGGDFMIPPSNDSVSSSGYRPGSPTIMPQYGQQVAGGIQQDQLAQLASYLGNARQSMGEDFRQMSNMVTSDNVYGMPQTHPSPNLQIGSEHHPAPPQYHHVQTQQVQQQQVSNIAPVGQSGQVNAQEGDPDPQKRLQATLELAATLLKQIQQGKT
ncbi:putative RNA recognition motif domain, nucleotide-binding alpha-beta plait domain superfamily [Helianthus annuus]|nr:putative RNA recognition motif domain, nucleotide-binding alpha-beta plait domain superfamily [Helianthus annuus]KAJ0479471.1 putative RNA recognition motif domain, nucleotide-binding alpha-beta plait domain superfamily [Helianthus annuus]KAJ0662412.1 putative RNA recognition motif domain, nucleotide-binding alpha-beta plait domain superfamily [Helianthus annuus]KAJ0669939.1 putative RNA recognition motif domain, nucleotide-binding alpha-beta plait domain superfamily [Helianthus annuus]KAJ08